MFPFFSYKTERPKNSQQFGRAVEYAVFSALIMGGGEIFPPAVDDDGVDVLVRRPKDHRYVSVQVKAVSNSSKDPGLFTARLRLPRPDYWFVFYSEPLNKMWVMTAEEFVARASKNSANSNDPDLYTINFGVHGNRFDVFSKEENLSRILY